MGRSHHLKSAQRANAPESIGRTTPNPRVRRSRSDPLRKMRLGALAALILVVAVPAQGARLPRTSFRNRALEAAGSNWLLSGWGTQNGLGTIVSDAHTGAAAGQVKITNAIPPVTPSGSRRVRWR